MNKPIGCLVYLGPAIEVSIYHLLGWRSLQSIYSDKWQVSLYSGVYIDGVAKHPTPTVGLCSIWLRDVGGFQPSMVEIKQQKNSGQVDHRSSQVEIEIVRLKIPKHTVLCGKPKVLTIPSQPPFLWDGSTPRKMVGWHWDAQSLLVASHICRCVVHIYILSGILGELWKITVNR